ncbi:MAG: hypothetical protein CMI01_00365 [Oceanospirillaceae bacterium]|nr:hypothetical protein [Oceanospirillaceae bacterium]
MKLDTAKEVLEAIGYPANGDDWEEVIADLQQTHGPTRVGSSMNHLGDAAPLFVKSGNVAHMVDHPNDLHRACAQIKSVLDQRQPLGLATLKRDVKSRWLSDIQIALGHEISQRERIGRSLGIVDTDYQIHFDPETRTQTRKPEQIINDLLSDDKKRNAKAVEALKDILIYKRAEAS